VNLHIASHPAVAARRIPVRGRLVLAACAATALAGGVTAAALPAANAAAASPSVTIRLMDIEKASARTPVGIAEIDVDHNGSATGKVVGQDTLECRISAHKASRCTGVIDLTKGDLLFTGSANQAGAKGKLVKATGGYAGWSGTAVTTNLSQTKTKIVIHLHK
jgi:hypothetical protein